MERDYSITIFSRHKGKTRTFNLDRRFIYWPVIMLVILVVSCILFGQAYFQEREERQRLEGRMALLEQVMSKFEERSDRQGGEAPKKATAAPAAQPRVEVALVQEKDETSSAPQEVPIKIGSVRETDTRPAARIDATGRETASGPVAKIDETKVSHLDEGGEGFKFSFKLVNLIGEPLAGNVAIIATLRPPHQPRFVSFPSMRLEDGMPVKLRKSVGFSIRYFKYVTGRFAFPFSYSESFRVLVYDQDEELILDSLVLTEDVASNELVIEEPAPTVYPADPSLSS